MLEQKPHRQTPLQVPALYTLTVSSLAARALLAGALMMALPVSMGHAAPGVIVRALAVPHAGLLGLPRFFDSQARQTHCLCRPVVS